MTFSFIHWSLRNVLFNSPHCMISKFSSHYWFQFTFLGCHRKYLEWLKLFRFVLRLNIKPILENILENISSELERDVYSSVLVRWDDMPSVLSPFGLYCHLGFLFPQWSYILLVLFRYLYFYYTYHSRFVVFTFHVSQKAESIFKHLIFYSGTWNSLVSWTYVFLDH